MQDSLKMFLESVREPGLGVIIIAISAIIVAGMSVYGMILAIKKRG